MEIYAILEVSHLVASMLSEVGETHSLRKPLVVYLKAGETPDLLGTSDGVLGSTAIADLLLSSFGGREKSLETVAKAGLEDVKAQGQKTMQDGKAAIAGIVDKATK